MEVKFKESDSKGAFYIEEAGEQLAEMTFSKAGDKMIIIDHTEVSEKLTGKNAGKQMVVAAVEYARSKGIKILLLCPFAKSVLQKDASLQDVL